jgi:hypothetical protein
MMADEETMFAEPSRAFGDRAFGFGVLGWASDR